MAAHSAAVNTLLAELPVLVSVMQVRPMRMRMNQRFMPVTMGMPAGQLALGMGVAVMLVVVAMTVLVFHKLVGVAMLVPVAE